MSRRDQAFSTPRAPRAPGQIVCQYCTMVSFCSMKCQSIFTIHKPICHQLLAQLMDRMGDTTQRLFQILSENTLEKNIMKVNKLRGVIQIYDFPNDIVTSGHVLFTLPNILTPDLDDRRAILSVDRTEYAAAYLHDVIKWMLEGSIPCASVQEAKVHMKRPPRAVVLPHQDNNSNTKVILQFDFFKGKYDRSVVVDPTGQLHGISPPTQKRKEYYDAHVQGKHELLDLGYQQQVFKTQARQPGFKGLPYKASFMASDYLKAGITKWMDDTHLTLPKLLRVPNDPKAFQHQLQNLIEYCACAMSRLRTSSEYTKLVHDAIIFEGA
ncbi:hypothetical protein P280DRAFT_513717 [Massarina eburnea CBS 473.64]|uniref:MYND-type zinc finger protein samB n=1 Tax=Massarina eburnea CBS 473.64 TaxID=1395130 RepID=A0A6A6SDC5_9PLEO|nr:hypothetical protein P280DRAFT_513717 [Massarina eburnea CBS 473.64]